MNTYTYLFVVWTFVIRLALSYPCSPDVNTTQEIGEHVPQATAIEKNTTSEAIDSLSSVGVCGYIGCPSANSAGHAYCRSKGCDYCMVSLRQEHGPFECDGGIHPPDVAPTVAE